MSDEIKVLKNRFAVFNHLRTQGYGVARGTVYKYCDEGLLKPTAPGGGWLVRAVENYASAQWPRKADAPAKPAKSVQGNLDEATVAEERQRAETELKRVTTERQRLKLHAERGQTVPREIVERDLALRAQAFRYGLENFIHDALGEIAAMFGGEERTAREIVRLVGGDESKAGEIVRRVQQREPELVAMWVDQVERFLEPYAEGSWWDDELARVMETAPKTDDGGVDAGSDSGE
ncbi:hypothetical protein [Desulfocurvibacter africanus]|uniref:hypothetical protein n=1 Tax=Desulfocurvibacter africanus TaxID=873 RepID=UPI0003FD5836|nr:hypothetical protein [Desulfocurvibacter africanus]